MNLNLFFQDGQAALVRKTEKGKEIVREPYYPHFYAICDSPEEKAYLFGQHPAVLEASVECGAVKVRTSLHDFQAVISDIRKVPGVKELAETSVPHHFRYCHEKGVRFLDDDTVLRLGWLDARGLRAEGGAEASVAELDVVFSYGGDRFLMGKPGVVSTKMGCFFREAIHIDLKTAREHDIYGESRRMDIVELGKERLIKVKELSGMTGVKPDLVSRMTPGKLNVYLHMAAAKGAGMLIPDIKKHVERPKTLDQLRRLDKGGTIFYPRPGVYADVAKCDFSSMYPNIIVRYNISPETMHCDCPDYIEVPEAGWRICRKTGIIPRGIKAVLERRLALKKAMRAETEPIRKHELDLRQKALKNILVTCLDGDTLIPYLLDGSLQIGKIKDVVDQLSEGKPGVFDTCRDLRVFGLDDNLRTIQNPVKKVLKLPSKPMIRLKLAWRREIKVTEDHLCYVLHDGILRVKRADELRKGDYVPVLSRIDLPLSTVRVDILAELMAKLPKEELMVWRVHGPTLKDAIAKNFTEICAAAGAEFTLKSIWNWRAHDYIPLKYLPLLGLRGYPAGLSVGRGKRMGGFIRKIPASIEIDQDLGFFIGFFLGDGSYNGNMLRLDLGIREKDVAMRLNKILWDKFRLKASLRKEKKANMFVFQVNSLALNRIMRLVFGLGGSSDSGKLELSPFILNSNHDFLFGFVSGLIASDGYMSKKRNFANIVSCNRDFIVKVGFVFSMLGLEYRLNESNHLFEIQLRDLKDLKLFYENGILKEPHKSLIESKAAAIRSYRNPQFPVFESGLFRLCRKTRTPPWLGQREMVSKKMALEQIKRMNLGRLDGPDHKSLENLKRLAESDIIFAKVVEKIHEAPGSQFVYCFEVNSQLPGFVCQGGIFTHNCFGYLGYKNFIFSNVECKECVVLYGRHLLERTKQMAEEEGLEVLYGMVDSVFVRGGTKADYERFVKRASAEFGFELELDCIFEKIAFPSSEDGSGVANKYYGISGDKIEARGIGIRHSDSPPFIKEFQNEAIRALFAEGRAGLEKSVLRYQLALKDKSVPFESLVIHRSVRKPDSLTHQPHIVAYRQLRDGGRSVDYVFSVYGPRPASMAHKDEINARAYLDLLRKAAKELVLGLDFSS